jgi:hypothetical protein
MTQHWVNPVNATSDAWGYELSPRELMRKIKPNVSHTWHAPTKKLQVDDLVWIRESLPLAAFIGVGTVATEPVQKDRTWYYEIKFDVARCHDMTAAPHHIEMDKRVIGPPADAGRTCSTAAVSRREVESSRAQHRKTAPDSRGRREARTASVSRATHLCLREMRRNRIRRACCSAGSAHPQGYDGGTNNQVTNGLLLRADVHNLFDLGLLWVSDTYKVQLDPTLRQGEYGTLHGKKLRLPLAKSDWPSTGALAAHREQIAMRTT